MSWLNPTQDEAAEEYYNSKSRYSNAADEMQAAQRRSDNFYAQRSQTQNDLNASMESKLNFERRVQDIESIISTLEDRGSICVIGQRNTLGELIGFFNETANETTTSFHGAVKCGEIIAASLHDVFRCKTVQEDPNSSAALDLLKKEKEELEAKLDELRRSIDAMTNAIQQLTSQIQACANDQASWRKVMMSCAYEMDHFKTFM